MNRFLTSLIIASLLTACAATAPERPQADWFQRVAGKRIYGLAAVTRDLPEDAILRGRRLAPSVTRCVC
jgi:hypothetical protein